MINVVLKSGAEPVKKAILLPDLRRYKVSSGVKKCLKNLLEQADKDFFTREELQNAVQKSVKSSTPIRVISLANSDKKLMDAGQDYIFDEGKNLKCLTIELPFKRGKFKKDALPLFLHELTHALFALHNPKTVKRISVADAIIDSIDNKCKLSLTGQHYNTLYSNYLYNRETITSQNSIAKILDKCKCEIKKLLAGLSAEEKINIIQNLRYGLISEYYAFAAEKRAADFMKSKGIKLTEEYDNFEYLTFLFREKIELLKEMGFRVIAKERTKLRNTAGHNS